MPSSFRHRTDVRTTTRGRQSPAGDERLPTNVRFGEAWTALLSEFATSGEPAKSSAPRDTRLFCCVRLNCWSFLSYKPMSKLTALKKQIAALEAQAERIAKEEMASAIAKVKDIMAEFNLTIEHLTSGVGGKRAAKKAKAKAKTASVAKYADPKTGKTWSGFGRAPGWIAGSKNRDAFLVGKSAAPEAVVKAPAAPKKVTAKAAKAVKAAKATSKPVQKKAVTPAKKTATKKVASVVAKKTPAAKKSAAKKAAPSKQVVAAPAESTA